MKIISNKNTNETNFKSANKNKNAEDSILKSDKIFFFENTNDSNDNEDKDKSIKSNNDFSYRNIPIDFLATNDTTEPRTDNDETKPANKPINNNSNLNSNYGNNYNPAFLQNRQIPMMNPQLYNFNNFNAFGNNIFPQNINDINNNSNLNNNNFYFNNYN